MEVLKRYQKSTQDVYQELFRRGDANAISIARKLSRTPPQICSALTVLEKAGLVYRDGKALAEVGNKGRKRMVTQWTIHPPKKSIGLSQEDEGPKPDHPDGDVAWVKRLLQDSIAANQLALEAIEDLEEDLERSQKIVAYARDLNRKA